MGRRKKNETAPTVKPPVNLVAVRKSSRQMARKQSVDEKQVNGVISQVKNPNNTEDSHHNDVVKPEKVKKKVGRRRKSQTRDKNDLTLINNTPENTVLPVNNDILESDSQETTESVVTEENVQQVSEMLVDVGNSHEVESEVVWPVEDVIEETIICDEMDVDGNEIETSRFTIADDGSVVLEQVLLMDQPNFEGKEVVEFTVIQNEDGTESMVVTSNENTENYPDSNEYIIETETVSCVEESVTTINAVNCENSIESIVLTEVVDEIPENSTSNHSTEAINTTESLQTLNPQPVDLQVAPEAAPSPTTSVNSVPDRRKKLKSQKKKKKEKKSISPNNLENKLESMKIESIHDSVTSGEDLSNCAGEFVLNTAEISLPSKPTTPELLSLMQNDDNSTSTSEKGDQIDFDRTCEPPSTLQHEELESSQHLNRTLTPNYQNITNHDDFSSQNTLEMKDPEDVKLSSSSENSNDTLNSMKLTEGVDKTTLNACDSDKKPVFRQRSGSTDTTGSESGSNSSAIRRSSRIRSQGLMKQRSRGRGLVTKLATEIPKVLPPDRDKLQPTNAPAAPTLREATDSQSETQSDKENSNKTHAESNTPANTVAPVSGYDSDSNKPVKVKSRWRRSSELEMGNSLPSRLALNSLAGPPSTSITTSTSVNDLSQSSTSPNVENPATILAEIDAGKDSTSVPTSNTSSPARLSVPPVSEEVNRELEERLSQFERLTENLYLTERYTNKETKRMVCDCFLTEEEIERGELGCGEDCLNRLLMIECGSRCVVSDRCTNKRFQNADYAKCEVFKTEKKGFGLRAMEDLEPGGFIMEYVGEVLDPHDFRRRAKEYSKDKFKHYYFMALKSDQVIDATLKGNISRFINHSCDPNAETQKWTVNGELRIGFFNRRYISAGEEITFDYHYQRFGKEAQKCFCDSVNCRGWIGDTPDEKKEKVEKKENRENRDRDRDVKKKREVKKSYMEDADLEEEIDKLWLGGLKNRAHTLTLSRLMVRSREIDHRTRLLRIIQSGEQPCRRLFLDYHGLRLMWSYMMDVVGLVTEEAQQFRLELLKTLSTLPIPNKTMLIDSKVFGVVEKWSTEEFPSPKAESPQEEPADKDATPVEEVETNCDSNDKPAADKVPPPVGENEEVTTSETVKQIVETAVNLLNDWSNLKEVFRIPKKERIEQMKEHEREADDGYRENQTEKEEKRDVPYENRNRYFFKRKGRDSPDLEAPRMKEKRLADDRTNLVPLPRLSKHERRHLFALKVAKEEQERIQRQQHEMWHEHEARCHALGIDPHTTAAVDPQTGYPLFFNGNINQWQSYPTIPEPAEVYGGPPSSLGVSPHQIPPNISAEISPGMPAPVYGIAPPPGVAYPPISHSQPPPQGFDMIQNNLGPVHNGTPQISGQHAFLDKAGEQFTASDEKEDEPEMPLLDLPPKWKCAKDPRGRFYYYHVKERVPQWLPPPPIHIGGSVDSSSSSESSEESSSSEEEFEEAEETEVSDPLSMKVLDQAAIPVRRDPRIHPGTREPRKRRDGLVQERIISPRREEKVDHKKYKDVKEKLRRQKERSKLKDQMEKLRKHRRANKAKSHARHTANKLQAIAQSNELTAERKIKDTFRINMANVMVRFLNPYRQNDCKQGRITNTEDFKYLARKLTHFVMTKELKHCKSVDELQCNENVKHKAKDFVRKYMGKFGPVYQRSSDED